MSDNTKDTAGGIGFLGLLTLVFITLKLVGYITWSWWWVLSPLWLPVTALVSILIIFTVALSILRVVKGKAT